MNFPLLGKQSVLIAFGVVMGLVAEARAEVTAPATPAPAAQGTESQSAVFDFAKIRDPFKQPEIQLANPEVLGPLQRYRVEELKMIAVIAGMKRTRAMVAASDGKTFVVSKDTKIGLRGGKVMEVSPERILVREKVVNVLGQEENLDTELKLQPEGRGLSDNGAMEGVDNVEKAGFSDNSNRSANN